MKLFFRYFFCFLSLVIIPNIAWSSAPPKVGEILSNEQSIESTIAGLSDEQVRRLLIDELKQRALDETSQEQSKEDIGGLAGFIESVKDKVSSIQARIAYLRAGGTTELEEVPGIFTYLGKGEKESNPVRAILSVIVVLVTGFMVELLFYWYTAGFRRRLESQSSEGWKSKTGALLLKVLVEFVSIVIFIAAAILIFYLFFERTNAQRVLVATYLSAIVVVRLVLLVSRFFLAPKSSSLRF